MFIQISLCLRADHKVNTGTCLSVAIKGLNSLVRDSLVVDRDPAKGFWFQVDYIVYVLYVFRGIDPVFTGTWQTAWRVCLSVQQAYKVQYICTTYEYCLLIDKHTVWIVVDSVVVVDSRDLELCFCFKNLFSLLYKFITLRCNLHWMRKKTLNQVVQSQTRLKLFNQQTHHRHHQWFCCLYQESSRRILTGHFRLLS